jgi:hypothetical protein
MTASTIDPPSNRIIGGLYHRTPRGSAGKAGSTIFGAAGATAAADAPAGGDETAGGTASPWWMIKAL